MTAVLNKKDYNKKYYKNYYDIKKHDLEWLKHRKAIDARWYDTHKEQLKKDTIKKRSELGNFYIRYLVRAAKARAKKYGIYFELTIDDINIPEVCPVLGVKLQYNQYSDNNIRDSRKNDSSSSIDRIDSTKGYISNNIIVVCNRVNRLKSDATIEELKSISEFYCKFK